MQRGGEHIKNNDCVNKQIAGRTKQKYAMDNREWLLQQKPEYGCIEYMCDVCHTMMRFDDKSKQLKTAKHKRHLKQLEGPTYDYQTELETKQKSI